MEDHQKASDEHMKLVKASQFAAKVELLKKLKKAMAEHEDLYLFPVPRILTVVVLLISKLSVILQLLIENFSVGDWKPKKTK